MTRSRDKLTSVTPDSEFNWEMLELHPPFQERDLCIVLREAVYHGVWRDGLLQTLERYNRTFCVPPLGESVLEPIMYRAVAHLNIEVVRYVKLYNRFIETVPTTQILEGVRNRTMFGLAKDALLSPYVDEWNEESLLRRMLDHNRRFCSPPMSAREVESIRNSILRYYRTGRLRPRSFCT